MITDIRLKKGSGVPSSLKLAEPAIDILNKILYVGLTEGENGGSDFMKIIDEYAVKEAISDIEELVLAKTTYSNSDPLIKDVGGILVSNHTNGFDEVPIDELITELLYPYTPAVINSFSLNPSAGAKEMNVPLDVKSATVKITKKS